MATDQKFRKKAVVFLVKFFVIYAVLQTIILIAPIEPLQNSIASLQASWLGLEVTGNTIDFGAHQFEIVPNCTGLVGISVLAAIIFSLRKPKMKKKLSLMGIGAVILFPLNLLRVYLVILTAVSFNPAAAEILHITTWFVTSAAILIIWYYLTKKVAKVKEFGKLL